MELFPLEVRVRIVEAARPADLASIRLACKSFKAAVEASPVDLKPSGALTGAQLVQISRRFPRAASLHLEANRLKPTGTGATARLEAVIAAQDELLLNLLMLESLKISFTTLVEFPATISSLAFLRVLDLGGCCSLTFLPEAISACVKLERLILNYCWCLRALPIALGSFAELQSLDLEGCRNLPSLPEDLGQLSGLRTLNLNGCKDLTGLPARFSNLYSLQARTDDLMSKCF